MSAPPRHCAPVTTDTTPARGVRRRSLRTPRILAIAAVAAVIAVAGDAALGAVAQQRAQCRVLGGVTVTAVDISTFPMLSALTTGSIGTARARVPWEVAQDRVGTSGGRSAEVSLSGVDGQVVAQTQAQGRPVTVTMRPEVTASGELALSPTGISVAGREVPLAVAQTFAGDLLQPRVLDGADSRYDVTSVTVGAAGLDLAVRMPLTSLAAAGDGQPCAAAAGRQ